MTIKRIAAIALCSMALGTMTCYAKKAKGPTVKLTKVDTFNYFIGSNLAQDMQGIIKQMQLDEKSDIKKDAIIKGFADALNGKLAINEDTMRKVASEYFQTRQAERQKAATEAYNQMAKKYEAMGFKDLGKPNDPRMSDYDGPTVRMKSITEGTGDSIKLTDYIYVDYEGKLAANDSVFDSTADKDPALFSLNQVIPVIPGFTQALSQMKKGAKAIFLIPSELVYGEQAMGPIPANSALVFTIEVKEVFKNEEEAQAFKEKQNK